MQLLNQYGDRTVKPRLYSLHELEVVCIAKGKACTRYEFGVKVSVVTTDKEGFVLDCQALAGKSYDGYTVDTALKRVLLHTRKRRGHPDQQHRRNSIEPIIGHLKSDGLMLRNVLRGIAGDKIHAILCGVGLNLRKLAELLWPYENRPNLRLALAILWSNSVLWNASQETRHLLAI